ncbi:MAG: GAF domain-containing protein, partial [bacterium]|nr:GAF domain-containing protein [bacterium]
DIISFTASYVEAQIGALYVALEDRELHRMSSYAYTPGNDSSSQFAFGQGMVGQAALEKKGTIIKNVPADYIRVTSGLGDAAVSNILLHPLIFDNNVTGVIELGFLSTIPTETLTFVSQAGESIAVAINSALSRTKAAKLLAQTQEQAEMLQKQQEDLRVANEELEEQ